MLELLFRCLLVQRVPWMEMTICWFFTIGLKSQAKSLKLARTGPISSEGGAFMITERTAWVAQALGITWLAKYNFVLFFFFISSLAVVILASLFATESVSSGFSDSSSGSGSTVLESRFRGSSSMTNP